MNASKNKFEDVIDPFDVVEGLFALDLVMMHVVPGPAAKDRLAEVKTTITRLGLNHDRYAEALATYYHEYIDGHMSFHLLQRRAPFLAQELCRQGKLLVEVDRADCGVLGRL